jgi:hypothetical protein
VVAVVVVEDGAEETATAVTGKAVCSPECAAAPSDWSYMRACADAIAPARLVAPLVWVLFWKGTEEEAVEMEDRPSGRTAVCSCWVGKRDGDTPNGPEPPLAVGGVITGGEGELP